MEDTAAARASHLSPLRHFYDVSWNLFKCLDTPPAIERENLIESIRLTLLKQSFDDDEDTSARRIELSECTIDPVSFRLGTTTFSGVAIYAEFTSGLPLRFIHYSNPAKEVSLLLSRGGMGGLGQGLTDSFFEMVGLSPYQRVELPSSLLSSQFESYLEALVPHAPAGNRESFIQNVVGKLDITVTAEAPVAPNLRSLNISIPATDVWTWLHSSPQHGTFLSRLSDYLQSMTGMQLDLGSSCDAEETPRKIPMSISDVSCGAFQLTRVGRLTLRKGPANDAETAQTRDAIEILNIRLLEAILSSVNDGS